VPSRTSPEPVGTIVPALPVRAVEAAEQAWVILSDLSASRVAPTLILAHPGA